ncbi:putative GPI anchored protein [Aspergillus undulatus]|uniref:putative GPI anchored protein n=1 Tax=Aspergillus undulatus TaxID=1810928 RepID=UPI003CCD3796
MKPEPILALPTNSTSLNIKRSSAIMRFQSLVALAGLLLAGKLALAAELDPDDVPDRCRSACDPVVSVARDCDRRNDNDAAEMDCICDSDQASTRIPQCEACIAQYRTDNPRDEDHDGSDDADYDNDDNDDADPHDNDAYDILTSCNFDPTTYAPASSHFPSSSASSSNAPHRSSSSFSHSSSPSSHTSSAPDPDPDSDSGYITTSGVYHPPASLTESPSPSVIVSTLISVSVSPSLIYVPSPSNPGQISPSLSSEAPSGSPALSGFVNPASSFTKSGPYTPPSDSDSDSDSLGAASADVSSAVRNSSPSVLMSPSTAPVSSITGNSYSVPT